MAPATARKSKSSKESASINSKLALVVKSGRIAMGYKQTLKNLRNGKGESHRFNSLFLRLCRLKPGGIYRGTGARKLLRRSPLLT